MRGWNAYKEPEHHFKRDTRLGKMDNSRMREIWHRRGLFAWYFGIVVAEKKKERERQKKFARLNERSQIDRSRASIDAFFFVYFYFFILMKGSGGWSDSLTCSIGGCRCRRGYRGSGSRTSRCSSPLLLLPQRSLLPCLPQPMLLLQLQPEKTTTATRH